MIDIHCHILPGLDDGPAHMEASRDLARAAVRAGTSTVVATPHIREDHPFAAEHVPAAVDELADSLAQAGIELRLVPGGEVAVTRLPDLDGEALRAVMLGDGPYVLVESPYTHMGELLERRLFDAQIRGLRPILAHPERSPCFMRDVERLERMVGRGVLCSVTAGSLAGRFGSVVRRLTVELVVRGLVHDIASDAHDARHRPPGLAAAFDPLKKELPGIGKQAEWFTVFAPGAILAGEELPPGPPVLARRRTRLRGRLGGR